MKRGNTEAETCALNGWVVGTRLTGDEGYGPTTIEITAIGERKILAKSWTRGRESETAWTLTGREWNEMPGTSDELAASMARHPAGRSRPQDGRGATNGGGLG